jgi:hypothetical protein
MAKSMTALAHQLAGLIGPLHEFCLRSPSLRLIRGAAGGVNATHFGPPPIAIGLKYQRDGFARPKSFPVISVVLVYTSCRTFCLVKVP